MGDESLCAHVSNVASRADRRPPCHGHVSWRKARYKPRMEGCLEADYRREQSFGPVAISSWAVPFLLSCGHVRPDSRGCRSKSKARNGCWDALREAHEGTRQSCAHARPMRWHGPGACASHARESSSTLVVFIWPHMPYFWPCTVRVVQLYVACLGLNAQN